MVNHKVVHISPKQKEKAIGIVKVVHVRPNKKANKFCLTKKEKVTGITQVIHISPKSNLTKVTRVSQKEKATKRIHRSPKRNSMNFTESSFDDEPFFNVRKHEVNINYILNR